MPPKSKASEQNADEDGEQLRSPDFTIDEQRNLTSFIKDNFETLIKGKEALQPEDPDKAAEWVELWRSFVRGSRLSPWFYDNPPSKPSEGWTALDFIVRGYLCRADVVGARVYESLKLMRSRPGVYTYHLFQEVLSLLRTHTSSSPASVLEEMKTLKATQDQIGVLIHKFKNQLLRYKHLNEDKELDSEEAVHRFLHCASSNPLLTALVNKYQISLAEGETLDLDKVTRTFQHYEINLKRYYSSEATSPSNAKQDPQEQVEMGLLAHTKYQNKATDMPKCPHCRSNHHATYVCRSDPNRAKKMSKIDCPREKWGSCLNQHCEFSHKPQGRPQPQQSLEQTVASQREQISRLVRELATSAPTQPVQAAPITQHRSYSVFELRKGDPEYEAGSYFGPEPKSDAENELAWSNSCARDEQIRQQEIDGSTGPSFWEETMNYDPADFAEAKSEMKTAKKKNKKKKKKDPG